MEENLRNKGFDHDQSPGAPICRWIYNGVKTDIMPTDEKILGFSNKWYKKGINNKISAILDDGTEISIFRPDYYLASKFEALKNRAGFDLRQSHDFEDIVYLIDNTSDFIESLEQTNPELKKYLKKECLSLLENPSLNEGVECALPYGSGDDRADIIENLIKQIAYFSE